METYIELFQIKTENPEAFLVEIISPGLTSCHIMVKDFGWNEKIEGVHSHGFRHPTDYEMKSISEQMKKLGAYSFQ
jgi:hypothetical protein